MLRKMLGIVTAVAAGLVVVGVAWASSDAGTSTTSSSAVSTSIAADSSTSSVASTGASTGDSTTTSLDGGVTSTSLNSGSTSTSLGSSSTSTSVGSSTSTTIDDTTSTSFDDSDIPVPDGTYQYQVATAGVVTIRVTNGAMSLASVNPSSGWSYTVEKDRSDEVEVEFVSGAAEASIRVKADHGELDVEIEAKSD